MDVAELEGIVEELYARAGAEPGDVWRPSRIARALGLRVVPVPHLPVFGQLARVEEQAVISIRSKLPRARAEWAVGHELGHWVGLEDERACDYVGAALLLRRRPFLRALYSGAAWHEIAERFTTTCTSAVLRAGELDGRDLAVVTPARTYARGTWPDEVTLRTWARTGAPGIARAKLRDDPRRVVLEGRDESA